MKVLIILPLLFVACLSANVAVNLGGGGYNFNYNTGDAGGHARSEAGSADGSVSGSYSYMDPNGHLRQVNYRAGPGIGFQATGDTGVDKNTLAAAAAIAAQAPKAPAPVSPWGAPFYGHYGGWNGRW
ncbi:adult-specific rigid cuticular protein 11.9-like [Centruroides sculpturatus]|uniref:adult-specific rigid cuticular protein 11.9-like n=1 Tax=Centruroides sculpturatus TaxID=218467 RepID=UPI000C6D33DA|nr:adult-specific rigid cuticular protein 11.9-like [Centruroides sculpturatus]